MKQHYPIMVVDDIHTNLVFISTLLKNIGLTDIITCKDSRQVMSVLEDNMVELVLMDIRMPHIDGYQLLSLINRRFPGLPVIIISEVSDVSMAVKCMRKGAFDYITKPVDRELFNTTLERALKFRELQLENTELRQFVHKKEDLDYPDAFMDIISENQKMIRIFKYIESIAVTSRPVFITGETGVGKELVAQVIHRVSGLDGRLVTLNISGLDDTVFSDTLFGHCQGAYTGADRKRRGLIEKAAQGTLFLDEIGDLSPLSQVKLLRLIQESEYFPLGEDELKISTARIIVATNETTDSLLASGKLRKDLVYRLKTHHIHIPPLRRRISDLPLLISHFMQMAATSLGKTMPELSESVVPFLKTYTFPGNIRELQGIIYDAISSNETGVITAEMLQGYCSPGLMAGEINPVNHELSEPGLPMPDSFPTIREMTNILVKEAMKRAEGSQTAAAKMLGISQPALSKRLKGL